jgi:membrane protein
MNPISTTKTDESLQWQRVQALMRHVWRHFREDHCFEVAGSLSYTSLLALVPLLAVAFGLLSSIDAFETWSATLQDFIFQNFVPSVGAEVQQYVQGFLRSTSGLTTVGFLVLIITSLLLMSTIEKMFNRIWRVKTVRRFGNRLVMYWAVLTLSPLLMGAGLALTARESLQKLGIAGGVPDWFNPLAIFVFTWLAISLAFYLVPNRVVNLRHALTGGLISALLFQLAKISFVFYVSRTNYTTLYQSLATVPIFLFWLYLSWITVLLGASLTAALTTFSFRRANWRWTPGQEFQLLYRLVGHLWLAQRRGEAVSAEQFLVLEEAASDGQIQRLLADLQGAGVTERDEAGNWFLCRDLEEMTLIDLLNSGHYVLPITDTDKLPIDHHWDRCLVDALRATRENAASNLERSLKSYYLMRPPETGDNQKRNE